MGGLPTYILISESTLSSVNPSVDLASLVHPVIHYRYADDPPIVPQGDKTSLLVMEFDTSSPTTPIVSSLSPNLAVDNVTVSDAPGAGAISGSPANHTSNNNNLYIINTLTLSNEK